MTAITGLDHVIIAVKDLDAGEAAMSRLGFRPTPRGYHSAHMGTANSTIVLPDNTYFEVLGVVSDTQRSRDILAGVDQGRHLFGVAMKTGDAAGAQAAFAQRSVSAGPVNDFSRPVELPGGTRDAAFRTAHIAAEASQGIYAFVCQHLTPDVVWRPDYLEQPNAVVGLEEVVACASDLDAVEAAWGRFVDMAIGRSQDGVTFDLGNGRLTFLSPAAFERRFGERPANDPGLGALVFVTADSAKTRASLQEKAVTLKDDGGTLIVPSAEASGVTFAFQAR